MAQLVQPPHLLGGIQSVCLVNHQMIITVMQKARTTHARHAQPGPERSRPLDKQRLAELAGRIKAWGAELGFQQVGITDTQLAEHEQRLERWLQEGFHGEMELHGAPRPAAAAARRNWCRARCA